MNLNEYQQAAKQTAVYPPEFKVLYPILGMNGEAGEAAEKVKKLIRSGKWGLIDTIDIKEIAKELGDCLWYISAAAGDLGLSLESVAQINLDKLANRAARDTIKGEGDNR